VKFPRALVAFLLAPLLLGSCAAVERFFRVAGPIAADALATYQRARELAPDLPADDPRIERLAARLLAVEAAEAASRRAAPGSECVADIEAAMRAEAVAVRERDALAAQLADLRAGAADGGAK